MLKGKFKDTVKQGLEVNDYFKLDDADEEGAHIKIKEGATPYSSLSIRFTPYHWKQKALKMGRGMLQKGIIENVPLEQYGDWVASSFLCLNLILLAQIRLNLTEQLLGHHSPFQAFLM